MNDPYRAKFLYIILDSPNSCTSETTNAFEKKPGVVEAGIWNVMVHCRRMDPAETCLHDFKTRIKQFLKEDWKDGRVFSMAVLSEIRLFVDAPKNLIKCKVSSKG